MKAIIDEGCVGCGLCVSTCEEVFRFNDEGLAEVYAEVTENLEGTANQAADECPVSVIRIVKE